MKFANENLASQLQNIGFSLDKKGRTIVLNSPISSMTKMITDIERGSFSARKNMRRAQGFFKSESENDDADNEGGSDKWRGGTVEDLKRDLLGGINMAPFIAQKTKLGSSQLLEKLLPKLAEVVPRRRRTMSEHDGEWDYSRRWEITPFAATKRALGTGRTVDINCHFAVDAGNKASQLNEYGTVVWAICDLIESAGIPVRVTCSYAVEDFTEGRLSYRCGVEIKKPGSYLAPNALAAVFQSNFFRRVIFANMQLAGDLENDQTTFGLGMPVQNNTPIEFTNGQIVISPRVTGASADEISAVLLEEITGKESAA